jgi:hypothetical protein
MFENRVLYHFASGNLVLTEELSPHYGLEAQEDHIEFHTPEQLYASLDRIFAAPALYKSMCRFGTEKAKRLFNSEGVYRRLVDELYLDVKLYGRRVPWD